MADSTVPPTTLRPVHIVTLIGITALAALLTIHRLGEADVCGFNEAVEGVFTQQMVEHGELLFPLLNGRTPMYKPPLYHWTATAIAHAAGIAHVTPFNLRLPAALYAIAGIALTMIFAFDLLGFSGAVLAGLILCGSYQYIEQGRLGRVDMTLCFFETLALFSFFWWLASHNLPLPDQGRGAGESASRGRNQAGDKAEEGVSPGEGLSDLGPPPRNSLRYLFALALGRQGAGESASRGRNQGAGESASRGRNQGAGEPGRDSLRYLFAIALGLAVLAKGPVGAILPAAACGVYLIAEKRFADLRRIAAPGPIVLTLALGLSWYAACYLSGRYAFLHRQLGSENFGRFFGSLGAMAPWYYVFPLLFNSAPLSIFVPVAVAAAIRTYFSSSSEGLAPRERPEAANRGRASLRAAAEAAIPGEGDFPAFRQLAAMRLFAIFWLVTVIFFSVAAYKRRSYLLPLWPASAVMLAWFVLQLSPTGESRDRPQSRGVVYPMVFAMAVGSILFNFFFLPGKALRDCGNDSFRPTAAAINRIVGAAEPLYAYGLGDEPATLIFYLDRNLPPLAGKLGDAPPGYVLIPAKIWPAEKANALDLTPVFTSTSGAELLILLRHGPALAERKWFRHVAPKIGSIGLGWSGG